MRLGAAAAGSFSSGNTATGGGTNVGYMSPGDCRAAGGQVVNCSTYGIYGKTQCQCYFPPAAAPSSAAPVNTNVTVSPTVTVSPQVSPVFQQQYQPSASPMSAGTSQVSAPAPVPAPIAPAPAQAAPAQIYAAGSGVPVAVPAQVAPLPALPETAYAVPPELAAQYPALQTAPGETVTAAPAPVTDWGKIALIGAGVIAILLLSSKKRGK